MQGQRIGYVRVSSFDQNPERQLEHVEVGRVFTDKASGKDTQRPELDSLLAFVREGDTVVVHSMDRLARNLDDLHRLVQKLTKRGVRIEFVKESLTFTGEDSPMANLMLSVMGAFAEFERALIRERQREGIALAKQRGAYRGRKKALSPEQVAELASELDTDDAVAIIDRQLRRFDRERLVLNGKLALLDGRFEAAGAIARYQDSATMKARLASDFARWSKIANDKGISAQ